MVKGIVLVLLGSMAAVASAQQDDSAVGVYRLRVSPEALSMARMVGHPDPEGSLKLAPDHTFKLSLRTPDSIVIRGGSYFVDGNTVTLQFRNHPRPVSGLIRSGKVVVEGLIYERDRSEFAGQSTRVATINPPSNVFSPDPNPPKLTTVVISAAPVAPASLPSSFCIVGSWTLHKDGLEDPTCHISFDKDGNFSYAGRGAKSAGKYAVHDCCVTLTWTQIDDDAVEFGTVKKDYPISPDGHSFSIDVYNYERCSKG